MALAEVSMAVRVFLVEAHKPMQLLLPDLLDSAGGFDLVGGAPRAEPA
jgi:hypothetical protein